MTGGTTEMLASLIDLLREKGVTEYEGVVDGLRLVRLKLGPLPASVEDVKQVVDIPRDVKKSRVGADGYTAAEQLEVYGRIMDAEE